MKSKTKKFILIAAVSLLCCTAIGISLAFIITNTGEIVNLFAPSTVTCAVSETFDGEVKSNVSIQNTGDTQAYIRAAVVVNWMTDDQNRVWAHEPDPTSDYTIVFTEDTNWIKGPDGFWYYALPVDPGASTTTLIKSVSLKDGVTPPEGYYFSVEIVATAIQSTPERVVQEQWGVSVDSDGKISK